MSLKKGFGARMLRWYEVNKRDLPWRSHSKPYHVWLSEIILQQTRVAYGIEYYNRFVKQFPTIHNLADASEEQVLKLWQGLGYYSRARNLHKAAKIIVEKYDGAFPDSYYELQKLPGIGVYTASAIASICFNKPHAVVDGNVYRVLARYFGIDNPINTGPAQKQFAKLAQELLDSHDPGNYNQAIMEFGALQCKPKNPLCQQCVFKNTCVALMKNKVSELPVKKKSNPPKKRYFNYIVPLFPNQQTVITQRLHKDIWQQLYEFPLLESKTPMNIQTMGSNTQLPSWVEADSLYLYNEEPWVHQLTHQHIYTSFWIAPVTTPDSIQTVSITMLKTYPVSRLIDRFLHKFFD